VFGTCCCARRLIFLVTLFSNSSQLPLLSWQWRSLHLLKWCNGAFSLTPHCVISPSSVCCQWRISGCEQQMRKQNCALRCAQ
jgi:hypothetical protein